MKLFIKLVLISIFHKKYINMNKLNQEFAFILACQRLFFHPEDKPFNKIFSKNEIDILIADDLETK